MIHKCHRPDGNAICAVGNPSLCAFDLLATTSTRWSEVTCEDCLNLRPLTLPQRLLLLMLVDETTLGIGMHLSHGPCRTANVLRERGFVKLVGTPHAERGAYYVRTPAGRAMIGA